MTDAHLAQQTREKLDAIMQEYRAQLKEHEAQLLQVIEEYEDAIEKIRVQELQKSLQ